MTRVKICGISNEEAGRAALEAGADYLGFVFYPNSIRLVTVERATELVKGLRNAFPQGWQAVGVFVNEPIEFVRRVTAEAGLDVVQLNGEEDADYVRKVGHPVIKAVRIGGAASGQTVVPAEFGAERLLVDASVPGRYGGTGVIYDWTEVRPIVEAGFLAGGLTPDNIGEAIRASTPWGVDVSSGVEVDGVKSPDLIRAFLAAVRAADAAEVVS